MFRVALLAAWIPLLVAGAAAAPRRVRLHSADFRRHPAFVPGAGPSRFTGRQGAVEQLGEVALFEGDETLVSDDGNGFGLRFDDQVQQPAELTQRFYQHFADEFDAIVVFTTFDDAASVDAIAYEISAQQDVRGLGQPRFDDSGPDGWGSPGHRLHAFVLMKQASQYPKLDGLPITDPRSSLYPILGQELAHRWLATLRYRDPGGETSEAMLGRDGAHWAATLDSDGSVMEGHDLVDQGDGSFVVADTPPRFSSLDLYAMGLLPPTQVTPWFLVEGARDLAGRLVDLGGLFPPGYRMTGRRQGITIQQVIAAEGERSPTAAQSPHQFRVAFVLLTRPGERAGEVVAQAALLDQVRRIWELRFVDYTGGRGKMCTQLAAPCGAPTARVQGGEIVERGGNGDGVIEPGEPIEVRFRITNDGPVAARGATVTASGEGVSLTPRAGLPPSLAPGQSAVAIWDGLVAREHPCGEPLRVRAESTVEGHRYRGFVERPVGERLLLAADFDQSAAWFGVNLDGGDTAAQNGWEHGRPREYRGRYGWIFQPDGGLHGVGQAWFTGLGPGHRPARDSSLAVGRSSLWSPAIDLAGALRPRLAYHVWFQATDLANPERSAIDDQVTLRVEASVDGGRRWLLLDEIHSLDPDWQRREVDLGQRLPGATRAWLRFVAQNPVATDLVEAGFDEVILRGQTAACAPAAAMVAPPSPPPLPPLGACALGRRPMPPPPPLALAVVLLALLRRRRRSCCNAAH